MEAHGGHTRVRVRERAIHRDLMWRLLARPKTFFLTAAGLSFVMSVSLFFSGDAERGIFVGIWVPSILSAGTLLLGSNNDD